MPVSRDDWNTALDAFKAASSSVKDTARAASELSLQHFDDTGDVVYCQEMVDSIDAEMLNRSGLIDWYKKFSPMGGSREHLEKDKSATAVEFDLAGAFAEPYWKFSPIKEPSIYNDEKIDQAALGLVRRFRNPKSNTPKNAVAEARLAQLELAVDAFIKSKPVVIQLPAPVEEQELEGSIPVAQAQPEAAVAQANA